MTEEDCELLAKKHIEAFLNECNLQSVDDAKLASQKMVAVAMDCMGSIHNGSIETVQ